MGKPKKKNGGKGSKGNNKKPWEVFVHKKSSSPKLPNGSGYNGYIKVKKP